MSELARMLIERINIIDSGNFTENDVRDAVTLLKVLIQERKQKKENIVEEIENFDEKKYFK